MKFIELMKEIVEDFESFKDVFPLINKDYAIVPDAKEKIFILEKKFIYSIFVAMGFLRPKTGKII